MITHRDVAALVAALYGNIPGVVAPAWLYRSNPDANVYMGIIRIQRVLHVITRGSDDLSDWLRDLWVAPITPTGRPEFGAVHAGMYGGTPEAADIVACYTDPDDEGIVFGGHSLGASRAGYIAASLLALGLKFPMITLCWGEPRWCGPTMQVYTASIPGTSYRNAGADGHDAVTDQPPFEYLHRTLTITDIDGGGRGIDIDPFRRHHFDLYLAATPGTPVVFSGGVPTA